MSLGILRLCTKKGEENFADTLGALLVSRSDGVNFKIGSGFDECLHQEIWNNQDKYLGKLAKYRHFSLTGVKDKPWFPVFLGFRDKIDV